MKTNHGIGLILCLALAVAVCVPGKAVAGFGSASVCVPSSSNYCMKTIVLGKAMPFVVVKPPAGPVGFSAPATLFVACPTNNSCGGACPGGSAAPVAASLTMAIFPYPRPTVPPPPIAFGAISTTGGTMGLPASSATGSFTGYSVPVVFPAGTPRGIYTIMGAATVTFSDGAVLTQTGDVEVCLVEPSPGNPNLPRLDLQLITPAAPRMAPGDQTTATYRIINNDPVRTVTLTGFATSKQNSSPPQGGNETTGVFAISSPFGDDFPIQFNTGPCITLPPPPYTQPEITVPIPPLGPRQTNTVSLRIRSFGECASGACAESTLRVQGNFSDGTPAFACGAFSFFVDVGQPTTGCGTAINDCNGNGIPDALDIGRHQSNDNNHNGRPDSCETNGLFQLNPGTVTPEVVPPYHYIRVSITGMNSSATITNISANGRPLFSSNLVFWTGTIPADTRPGPQTVYFLGKDTAGNLAGQIATYSVASNGPAMNIQLSSNIVTLSWEDLQGPYLLQKRTNINAGNWTDVLFTHARTLSFPTTDQVVFYRLTVPPIIEDPVNYDAGRLATAQLYNSDVKYYWVHYGIPPLCRLSDMLESGGENPTNAFTGLMQAFNETTFVSAHTNGLLPLEFSNHVSGFEMAGDPASLALIQTFRLYVDELDLVKEQQGTNAPRVGEIYQLFDDVFPFAFSTNGLAILAPQPTKTIDPYANPVTNTPNYVDLHGTDNFTTNIPPAVTETNNAPTNVIPWKMITSSSVWRTASDGECATLATGASLAKLETPGFPKAASCLLWEALSQSLGATPTSPGGKADNIGAVYESFGYSCCKAYNGITESAAEEADKALKRGCDVTIEYRSPDGTEGHIEMVEDIAVDPNNARRAIVKTLSWGTTAYVTYDNYNFSGKTDGNTYGGFLQTGGTAIFRYYCKK